MLYLQSFTVPTREAEEQFLCFDPKNKRTCYTTKYPFGIFRYRELPTLEFAPLTVFYGGNGSGKTTLLNVIAQRLHLNRLAPYNRSDFFEDYVALCRHKLARGRSIPAHSTILTSDDVFDTMLDTRKLNEGIDTQRAKLFDEYLDAKATARLSDAERNDRNRFTGLADYDNWRRRTDALHSTQSQFVRERLPENRAETSNGETAFRFFADQIQENALYLLDEPENSLSAARQVELCRFLEDSVRFFGCQFIISTHSPFLLAAEGARVYDLDAEPPVVRPWTELSNIRVYHDFFERHRDAF